MPTFIPPTTDGRLVGDPSLPSWAYFKFLGSWETGQTVWKDAQGVWHRSIEPYLGGATHTVHDGSTSTVTAPDAGLATAQKVYLGGHVHTISDADAAELVAAGFSVNILSESFNKADGALGPNLAWTREVFTHAHPFTVVGNRAKISTTEEGTFEDIHVPSPNVSSPDVVVTVPVAEFNGTGSHYLADAGAVVRYVSSANGTDYRGYAFAVGRSRDIFLPGTVLWHFAVFRIEHAGIGGLLLDVAIATEAQVVLPGTITFTADGPNLSGTFTHAGPGPTLELSAVDTLWADGIVVLGGSAVADGASTAEISIESFDAREIIP